MSKTLDSADASPRGSSNNIALGAMGVKPRHCGMPLPRVMVLLCAFCGLLNYADRVNMSVCIIALGKDYSLNVTQRGMVLSAFFWGYVPSQLIAALLCRRLGAKKVLGYGAFGWSFFTAFTPIAARWGLTALVACRVGMGLTEGVAFPSMYHVFGEWVPAVERGRAMALLHTGVGAGTTIALVLSPHIIRIASWHAVFYFFGAMGGVWLLAWIILARDLPKPQNSIGDNNGTSGMLSPAEVKAIFFMLRNRACLAQMATQFLTGLYHYTCLSWLPTYFATVFSLKATELWFTFVPYLASTLLAPVGGMISDGVAVRTRSIEKGRKVTTALACGGAGVLVLAFSTARSVPLAVATISAALALFGFNSAGFDAAYLDLSEPQYAGLLKSVANTLGAASGAIAVVVAAKLLLISGSWRFVFACQATWAFAATAVFVKFGSSTTVLTDARFIGTTSQGRVGA